MNINIFLNKKNKISGFTFIELIIAITIIAFLSVLGFISYSGNISKSRDSNRKTELSDIYSMLDLYKTKSLLPIPDKRIDIYSSGILLGSQGYLSNDILRKIGYKGPGKDPLDNTFYTYYLTQDLRNQGLLGFLENEENSTSLNLVNKTYAIDYKNRFPVIYGKKLGILVNKDNIPIQELSQFTINGTLEINTLPSDFIAFFNNKTSVVNSVGELDGLYGTNIVGILGNSCEQYIEESDGIMLRSGYYLINSGTGVYRQLCDMSSTSGSGTSVRSMTCTGSLPINSFATKGNTYLQYFNGIDWGTELTWNITGTTGCDFDCNTGYGWSGSINSCLQITNGYCGFPNGFRAPPTPTPACIIGNASLLVGSGPWSWDCEGENGGSTANCSTLASNTCMAGGYVDLGCIAE
ncbi:prepilin-type N-terminal cleavage/methylation domain-containing protein [Candidatus Gracilibacteria bacterium]|nr:prepilin-type N-terminal cleavage/methylation domain-containing protein [Candidatus Gracilibacteria bacterium]